MSNHMTNLLAQFVEYSKVQNYSPRTVQHRHDYINVFIAWAEQRGLSSPNEVTKPVLERYRTFLYHYRKRNGDPLSIRSQVIQLIQLRAWFKWMAKNNHTLFNPASELELPRQEMRLPKFVLTPNEAEIVLSVVDMSNPMAVRDRAILETLYSTGMRRMELINLSTFDVDVERGTVIIRQGKGKKDRMIPIGERAIAWIEKYKQEVRPTLIVAEQSGDTLFLTNLGGPFAPGRLSKMVADFVDAAQVGKRGSCHLFRHTMATAMLENGADIRYIQAILGHADLKTTAMYTQVSIRLLKQIHTATHPARMERPATQKADADVQDGNKTADAGSGDPGAYAKRRIGKKP
jgi:integrase/recombinase XerD